MEISDNQLLISLEESDVGEVERESGNFPEFYEFLRVFSYSGKTYHFFCFVSESLDVTAEAMVPSHINCLNIRILVGTQIVLIAF